MDNQLDNALYDKANRAINDGVVHDLNKQLAVLKERVSLMKHRIHESNPLQIQLNEILGRIDESIESTNLLSSFAQVEGFSLP